MLFVDTAIPLANEKYLLRTRLYKVSRFNNMYKKKPTNNWKTYSLRWELKIWSSFIMLYFFSPNTKSKEKIKINEIHSRRSKLYRIARRSFTAFCIRPLLFCLLLMSASTSSGVFPIISDCRDVCVFSRVSQYRSQYWGLKCLTCHAHDVFAHLSSRHCRCPLIYLREKYDRDGFIIVSQLTEALGLIIWSSTRFECLTQCSADVVLVQNS